MVAGGDLDAALDRYRRVHFRRLAPHHFLISDLSSGRPANPFEKLMYRAAARDEDVVREFGKIGSRRESPALLLNPRTLARMVRAAA